MGSEMCIRDRGIPGAIRIYEWDAQNDVWVKTNPDLVVDYEDDRCCLLRVNHDGTRIVSISGVYERVSEVRVQVFGTNDDVTMGTDSDDDGIPDELDAFPFDPAASVDTDGDGMPDQWNLGYFAEDSTSSPRLVKDDDDDNDGVLDLSLIHISEPTRPY